MKWVNSPVNTVLGWGSWAVGAVLGKKDEDDKSKDIEKMRLEKMKAERNKRGLAPRYH
jgi:hypothetical protein